MNILFVGMDIERYGAARLVKPLAAAGFGLAALCPDDHPVAHSSHLARHFPLRDIHSSQAIGSRLAEAMRAWQPRLIIPCGEPCIAALQAFVRAGEAGASGPLTPEMLATITASLGKPDQFDAMLLKGDTLKLARSLGVRVPAGATVATVDEALTVAERIGFPVYVKKSFSWGGNGVISCRDANAVAQAVNSAAPARYRSGWFTLLRRAVHRNWIPKPFDVEIQKAISGTPAMFTAVALNGRMLAGFAGTAQQTSSVKGPSSVAWIGQNAQMEEAARAMIGALGATGFIGFDFMIDDATGDVLLLECNPRPTPTSHLGSRIGIDLCAALAAALMGGTYRCAAAPKEDVIALFPNEWLRHPEGIWQAGQHVDIPYDDPKLLKLMVNRGKSKLEGHAPGRLATALSQLRGHLASPFGRNLGSMGAAQIAMRISRLVTTVILARLLSPNDYGMAAIVLTVYELVALFTRNGISAKVVQASEDEVGAVAQTAYWMTWIVCGGLLVFQLLIAVPAAWLYHDMRLATPIALMGLIYLATPFSIIQCAFMQREGRLGRIALAGGTQVVADNFLTAIFAMLGMGMWAIVLPKLLVAPIWVLITRYGHDWRPQSRNSAGFLHGWRDIARFSRHVIGVELLTTLQANIDNLLVGYFLGMEALGVYYFAFNAGLGITLGLVNAFAVAVYPHLCKVRGVRALLTARYRDTFKTLGMLLVPLILLQVTLAPIYVPLVFGRKWVTAVPVLMIICLSALPRPFASTCSQLLKAVGRPDIELRWQMGLTAILVTALTVAAQFSLLAVAISVLTVQASMLTLYCLRAPRPFIDGRSFRAGASLRSLAANLFPTHSGAAS